MDKSIRDTLTAKANEVAVPPGAWERQQAMLQAMPPGGGRVPRRWAPGRAVRGLAALAAAAILFALALAGGLGRSPRDGGGPGPPALADGGGPGPPAPAGGAEPNSPAPPDGTGSDTAAAATAPAVPRAFRGLGRLAFVRDGRLYILDGATDMVREVAGAAPAMAPAWSADGRWLAFVSGEGTDSRLMLADAASGRAREVTGLPGPAGPSFAWAPRGQALAVAAQPAPAPGGAVWLVDDPANPQARLLAQADAPLGSLRWSPDGSQIAYVMTWPAADPTARSDALEVVPATGGSPARWYVAERAGIDLVGWWPDGGGVLFWVRPEHCNSCAADGLPLQSLRAGALQPLPLATTLLYPDWLSWGPGGRALVLVRGAGRPVWDGKGLAVCDAGTGGCRDLPQPGDAVSLDPAWAPDGSRLAFVRAQRRPGEWGFGSEAELAGWVASRTLWLAAPDGSAGRELTAAGRGVYSPAWARDGRHILYVKAGALWVLDLDQEKADLVAGLGAPPDLFGFYGHAGWSRAVAWYRGT